MSAAKVVAKIALSAGAFIGGSEALTMPTLERYDCFPGIDAKEGRGRKTDINYGKATKLTLTRQAEELLQKTGDICARAHQIRQQGCMEFLQGMENELSELFSALEKHTFNRCFEMEVALKKQIEGGCDSNELVELNKIFQAIKEYKPKQQAQKKLGKQQLQETILRKQQQHAQKEPIDVLSDLQPWNYASNYMKAVNKLFSKTEETFFGASYHKAVKVTDFTLDGEPYLPTDLDAENIVRELVVYEPLCADKNGACQPEHYMNSKQIQLLSEYYRKRGKILVLHVVRCLSDELVERLKEMSENGENENRYEMILLVYHGNYLIGDGLKQSRASLGKCSKAEQFFDLGNSLGKMMPSHGTLLVNSCYGAGSAGFMYKERSDGQKPSILQKGIRCLAVDSNYKTTGYLVLPDEYKFSDANGEFPGFACVTTKNYGKRDVQAMMLQTMYIKAYVKGRKYPTMLEILLQNLWNNGKQLGENDFINAAKKFGVSPLDAKKFWREANYAKLQEEKLQEHKRRRGNYRMRRMRRKQKNELEKWIQEHIAMKGWEEAMKECAKQLKLNLSELDEDHFKQEWKLEQRFERQRMMEEAHLDKMKMRKQPLTV